MTAVASSSLPDWCAHHAVAPPSAPLVIATRAAAFEETPAWVKPAARDEWYW
jgi:hypothetical protein